MLCWTLAASLWLECLLWFSGLPDEHHHQPGPELCGVQQPELAAAPGSVRHSTPWRQGCRQSPLHLHHAQVRLSVCSSGDCSVWDGYLQWIQNALWKIRTIRKIVPHVYGDCSAFSFGVMKFSTLFREAFWGRKVLFSVTVQQPVHRASLALFRTKRKMNGLAQRKRREMIKQLFRLGGTTLC